MSTRTSRRLRRRKDAGVSRGPACMVRDAAHRSQIYAGCACYGARLLTMRPEEFRASETVRLLEIVTQGFLFLVMVGEAFLLADRPAPDDACQQIGRDGIDLVRGQFGGRRIHVARRIAKVPAVALPGRIGAVFE